MFERLFKRAAGQKYTATVLPFFVHSFILSRDSVCVVSTGLNNDDGKIFKKLSPICICEFLRIGIPRDKMM